MYIHSSRLQSNGVLIESLEAISKPQIAAEGKAGADEKAQHTRGSM
jgi:hypothetical protein